MATWDKELLPRENGEIVPMQVPEIISASRSTDIPAFYADWFFHRLKVGYSAWTNPFNGVRSYVSYKNVRFIVFWSKNPKPLFDHLDYLVERKIGCYIQFSLNDYEDESLEQGVPPISERLDTFKRLVDKLGVGRVIWRFDPLILTNDIDIDKLLHKIEHIGDRLHGYTEKLVFSYADILGYRKVKANLEKNNIIYHEWTEPQMLEFAKELSELNKKWNYELATCGERINLKQYGIMKNHCIDYDLLVRFANNDEVLMKFIGATIKKRSYNIFGDPESLPASAIELSGDRYVIKDGGQRDFCGCMRSKDIGEYNTCKHLCEYCYANANKAIAIANYNKHISDPYKESIT